MKLSEMNLTELAALYGVATSICAEYAKMTDGYILATGTNVLDTSNRIPADVQNTINERQQYFAIKDRITNELKNMLLTEIDYE